MFRPILPILSFPFMVLGAVGCAASDQSESADDEAVASGESELTKSLAAETKKFTGVSDWLGSKDFSEKSGPTTVLVFSNKDGHVSWTMQYYGKDSRPLKTTNGTARVMSNVTGCGDGDPCVQWAGTNKPKDLTNGHFLFVRDPDSHQKLVYRYAFSTKHYPAQKPDLPQGADAAVLKITQIARQTGMAMHGSPGGPTLEFDEPVFH